MAEDHFDEKGTVTRRQFVHRAGLTALGLLAGTPMGVGREEPTSRPPEIRAGARRRAQSGQPPNIIFIMADDLGYGDLGCYGQEVIQTPNLDRFAAEGMRFTQCYAASPVCGPSRWCLMTGLHTGHAHTVKNAGLLYPEDVTVAEVLKGAGYITRCIGKWGMGQPGSSGLPREQGYDYFYGYLTHLHAHNYYPYFLWENEWMSWIRANLECQKGAYSHDLFTERALDFVRAYQRYPFFLYLTYTIPHANNELGQITGNGIQVPSDEPYSDEDWPQPERNYAAMITRLDEDIGRIMQLLKELGIDLRACPKTNSQINN